MNPNLCPLEKNDFDEIASAFKKIGWNKPKNIYEAYFKEQTDGIRSIILAKGQILNRSATVNNRETQFNLKEQKRKL